MNFPKLQNMLLLVVGFGLGQGSLFLSNTYLFWRGQHALVAEFGTANAIATLSLFVGDWGGALFVAKEVVAPREGALPIMATYFGLSIARLLGAVAFTIGLLSCTVGQSDSFFHEYLTFASLGLLFYSFNAIGLLDGNGRSGVSGVTQAIPSFGVAAALPFCAQLESPTAGRLLGGLFAVGVGVSVVAQVAVARVSWRGARAELSARRVLRIATTSMPYMLTALPGQFLFRIQVLLAVQLLPTALVSLFIYCRQIIGIGYQLLGFYLRVDIRDFAEELSRKSWTPVGILRVSTTVRLGAIGTVACLIASMTLSPLDPLLSTGLAAYSPCIFCIAVSVTLQRVWILKSRAVETTVLLSLANLLPVLLIYPIFSTTSIYSLIVLELLSLVLQSTLFLLRWNRR